MGVALGGAAKNVYAIGCGIVAGMGLGESARAALLTRSFAELCRLGRAMGAKNRDADGTVRPRRPGAHRDKPVVAQFRLRLPSRQGQARANLLAPGHPLAEGVETAAALVARAGAEIEFPVAEAIADILSGTLSLEDAMPG